MTAPQVEGLEPLERPLTETLEGIYAAIPAVIEVEGKIVETKS